MELVSYGGPQKLPPLKNPPDEPRLRLNSGVNNKYTLSESQIAHPLPPRNALKAYTENNAGIIDTWPSHSQNQMPSNVQLLLNKNNRLVLKDSNAEGKPDLVPKPKFLENLEDFLVRELKALGCYKSSKISESRLQAFREVFEYLIEEFRTYKPLMSSIKNEYELMLAHQRERIRELEPLKQMLVTLSEQCDQRLMQYREEEKGDINELKDEKKRLLGVIGNLKQEMESLQSQVDRLHSELKLEHERYRDEHDKKKLLISDLNDLRAQQEEAKQAEIQREKKRAAEIRGTDAEEDSSNDDPVTLKLALKICRQNLTDAMKRLTKMEADYGDVIPRRDYLTLEVVYKEMEEKTQILEKDYKHVKSENASLKETCKNLESKLNDATNQIEFAKGNSTPRPDWDKCGAVIDGGYERWRDITNNKSSNEIVGLLINEMTGGGQTGSDYFTGYGTGLEIPFHLRYDGELKNRHINKRDAALTIYDIWKERGEYNATESESISMSQFVFQYFKKRFPSDQMSYEWCYNLNDACERFLHNENIQLFKNVVNDQLDEEIYHHERLMLTELLESLIDAEAKEGRPDQPDSISRAGFQAAIKKVFNFKSNDDIEALTKAAEEELDIKKDARIEYKVIMAEDDEGKTGLFLTTLKKQMNKDRLAYAREIKNILVEKNQVSVNDFRRGIGLVDQNISEQEIDRYIAWVFNVNKQEQSLNKTIDLDDCVKKLENCCVYKHNSAIAAK